MIVLAVEQGIASLPPTSGQSFSYEYDAKLDTYHKSEQMGPTAFRSPQTVAPGVLNLRFAMSYFEAARALGPIDYTVTGPGFENPRGYCTRFGLDASADVTLFNLSATYGIAAGLDASVNIPLVLTDTHASEVFITNDPTSDRVVPAFCDLLDPAIHLGVLTTARRSFSSISVPGGKVQFNDGTNFGLGRISAGGKFKFYSTPHVQLAFAPEFFFPSPDQAEFAGSDSAAVSPRIVGQIVAHEHVRLHADVGYDYDFSENALRRLGWNTGASLPFVALKRPVTVDVGIGGSRFNEGITWTPQHIDTVDNNGQLIASFQTTGNNTLGNTFVDFLGGIKIAITKTFVLSGAVDVPLNGEGFRPDAVGTVGAEIYL